MEERIREFIRENSLIQQGQTVGVATSGGPDSMALLCCLRSLAAFFSYSIVCVHFEHGIRGEESLADADFVERYCKEYSVPFYMSAADVPALAAEWKVSEETAAKKVREAYFDSLVKNGDVDVVATGHHSDDNAESILMHILRGSGIDGLKGISVVKGNLVRPLLCVTREEIMQYISEKELAYVEDKTNQFTEHTRNFVRNVLFPQIREKINPGVTGALNRLGAIAQEDSSFVHSCAQVEYGRCAVKKEDQVRIDIAAFLSLAPAVAYRVLKIACEKLYVVQDIEKVHIDAALKLAKNGQTGMRVNLPGGLCAETEYGSLILRFAGRRVDYSFHMIFDPAAKNEMPNGDYIVCTEVRECDYNNQNPYTAYVDLDRLPARLVCRTRHDGDRIFPLGNSGSKKLKNYFIDKKLTREERERVPLLVDEKNIVWVIGHTIGNDYRVKKTTKRILRMDYIHKNDKKEKDMMGEKE